MAEEPSLPYYLPIAGKRIIGFIPFPRVLVLCEMQSVSLRIWTRVAMSISYDGNHYTTGTSFFLLRCIFNLGCTSVKLSLLIRFSYMWHFFKILELIQFSLFLLKETLLKWEKSFKHFKLVFMWIRIFFLTNMKRKWEFLFLTYFLK